MTLLLELAQPCMQVFPVMEGFAGFVVLAPWVVKNTLFLSAHIFSLLERKIPRVVWVSTMVMACAHFLWQDDLTCCDCIQHSL